MTSFPSYHALSEGLAVCLDAFQVLAKCTTPELAVAIAHDRMRLRLLHDSWIDMAGSEVSIVSVTLARCLLDLFSLIIGGHKVFQITTEEDASSFRGSIMRLGRHRDDLAACVRDHKSTHSHMRWGWLEDRDHHQTGDVSDSSSGLGEVDVQTPEDFIAELREYADCLVQLGPVMHRMLDARDAIYHRADQPMHRQMTSQVEEPPEQYEAQNAKSEKEEATPTSFEAVKPETGKIQSEQDRKNAIDSISTKASTDAFKWLAERWGPGIWKPPPPRRDIHSPSRLESYLTGALSMMQLDPKTAKSLSAVSGLFFSA